MNGINHIEDEWINTSIMVQQISNEIDKVNYSESNTPPWRTRISSGLKQMTSIGKRYCTREPLEPATGGSLLDIHGKRLTHN